MAAPTLDLHGNSSSSTSLTTTISVSTGGTNKLVVVACCAGGTSTTVKPALSISGASLTWTAIDATAAAAGIGSDTTFQATVQMWWAIAPTQLTTQTITITSSQTIDDWATVYASFSGVYTSSPVDAAVGATFANYNVPPNKATLTSTSSNTVAVVAAGSNRGSTTQPMAVTAPTALIDSKYNTGAIRFSFIDLCYHAYTAAQTGVTVGFDFSYTTVGVIGAMFTADAPVVVASIRQTAVTIVT